ncbi:hypothetical protein [Salinimicrobium terrae]|uniref:hypothetical protein n=1 Tax=Salinimicrobium terrae TaxID=470866 RepID=UPI0003F8A47B|nr:hypothetical protein [Salinimicrobium terrae]
MKKINFGIVAVLVLLVSVFSFKERSPEKPKMDPAYEILQKWDLPNALSEVSGIAWLGEERIACVQDEDGIIFIYNLQTSKIESKTKFGNGGDYEGIAVIENDAYILRSDGIIFKVGGFTGQDPQVQKHVTTTNQLHGINLEGLCADPANNRLLMAVKEGRNFNKNKGIYVFDLNKNNSDKKPLFLLELSDSIFDGVDEKLKNRFAPGEIGIHPQTGEYFILDGTRPKILITDEDGAPKELLMLRSRDFGNPEGLTFSPAGDLYISNEAADGPANILKVSLNRK